jgi:hypothetical protein
MHEYYTIYTTKNGRNIEMKSTYNLCKMVCERWSQKHFHKLITILNNHVFSYENEKLIDEIFEEQQLKKESFAILEEIKNTDLDNARYKELIIILRTNRKRLQKINPSLFIN